MAYTYWDYKGLRLPAAECPVMRGTPAPVTAAGQPPSAWAEVLAAAPLLASDELAGTYQRLVVVGAHPDDETIGAGRLIAAWARRHGPVVGVTATAGEACLDHVGVHIPGLAGLRVAEWQAALKVLGAQPQQCCGLPDGSLGDHLGDLVSYLCGVIEAADLVLAPWAHDPHPDHAAAGHAARQAAGQMGSTVVEYPVWATYWLPPDTPARCGYDVLRVATDEHDERARSEALAEYRSQLEPLHEGLGVVVPADMLTHHVAQMIFIAQGRHRA